MATSTASGLGSAILGPALRTQPDSRLVRLVREGHERAFEEIDRRYRARLTGYAGSFVGADRADDVVQDALIKAYTALGAGTAEMNLKPWLYQIVRNTALNNLRDEPPPHEELDLQFDGVPQPPDIVARREQIRELVAAIKALPEQQREAIVQRELGGRSHGEIAGALGVSSGAVRQLIFRARRGVRESFGALLPLPILRYLLSASDAGVAGAAGLGAGAGGGLTVGAVKVAALLAVGGGLAAGVAHEVPKTGHRLHQAIEIASPPAANASVNVRPASHSSPRADSKNRSGANDKQSAGAKTAGGTGQGGDGKGFLGNGDGTHSGHGSVGGDSGGSSHGNPGSGGDGSGDASPGPDHGGGPVSKPPDGGSHGGDAVLPSDGSPEQPSTD